MKYKGIIFDLDGVICHTDQYHYQAWKKTADSIGVYFDEIINNQLRGISRTASLEIILERSGKVYSVQEKKVLEAKKNRIYQELLLQMTPEDLSDDVRAVLDGLKAKGFKLAIGSSSRNAKLILDRLGIRDYFDVVSDGTNITHSKPDPEVFLKAAEFLDISPKDCLVVEDAVAGIDAAIVGNFSSAGIGEASMHEQVTYQLQNLRDLLNIVC